MEIVILFRPEWFCTTENVRRRLRRMHNVYNGVHSLKIFLLPINTDFIYSHHTLKYLLLSVSLRSVSSVNLHICSLPLHVYLNRMRFYARLMRTLWDTFCTTKLCKYLIRFSLCFTRSAVVVSLFASTEYVKNRCQAHSAPLRIMKLSFSQWATKLKIISDSRSYGR